MINPRSQVSAEIHIQAARTAVWQKFIRLHEWPTWQPTISAAHWENDSGWHEGARFQITMGQQQMQGIIRMVSTESVTVWEVTNPALNAVYTLHCTDQLGGCKVTIRCTYHGVAALFLWLQRGKRQRELAAILTALKSYFVHL